MSDYPKEDVSIPRHDLRALLFWAAIGITKSRHGAYPDASERPGDLGIVNSCANHIKFQLPVKPRFGSRYRAKNKKQKC